MCCHLGTRRITLRIQKPVFIFLCFGRAFACLQNENLLRPEISWWMKKQNKTKKGLHICLYSQTVCYLFYTTAPTSHCLKKKKKYILLAAGLWALLSLSYSTCLSTVLRTATFVPKHMEIKQNSNRKNAHCKFCLWHLILFIWYHVFIWG